MKVAKTIVFLKKANYEDKERTEIFLRFHAGGQMICGKQGRGRPSAN
jgi:hypothetical protein